VKSLQYSLKCFQPNSDLVINTLADILQNKVQWQKDQAFIFSPMGLGTLDLVIAQFIYQQAKKQLIENMIGFF